jgi:hypothetical protein
MKVTANNYGRFIINSQRNLTGTYFADTVDDLEHDRVYRYLKSNQLTPRMVSEKTKPLLSARPRAFSSSMTPGRIRISAVKIGAARTQKNSNAHHIVHRHRRGQLPVVQS